MSVYGLEWFLSENSVQNQKKLFNNCQNLWSAFCPLTAKSTKDGVTRVSTQFFSLANNLGIFVEKTTDNFDCSL